MGESGFLGCLRTRQERASYCKVDEQTYIAFNSCKTFMERRTKGTVFLVCICERRHTKSRFTNVLSPSLSYPHDVTFLKLMSYMCIISVSFFYILFSLKKQTCHVYPRMSKFHVQSHLCFNKSIYYFLAIPFTHLLCFAQTV